MLRYILHLQNIGDHTQACLKTKKNTVKWGTVDAIVQLYQLVFHCPYMVVFDVDVAVADVIVVVVVVKLFLYVNITMERLLECTTYTENALYECIMILHDFTFPLDDKSGIVSLPTHLGPS